MTEYEETGPGRNRVGLKDQDLMFNVYPRMDGERFKTGQLMSQQEMDRERLNRKRHAIFDEPFHPDESKLFMTEIVFSGHKDDVSTEFSVDTTLVPPTLFHFELIAEGYMGYKFRDSVGADKKESAAVMGGQ